MEEQVQTPEQAEEFWQDIGRPEEPATKPILFAYTVIVGTDGAIHTQVSEVSDQVIRKASTYDVFSTCRDLVSDIESQMLATRVSQAVTEALKETDPKKEAREKLLSALNNRGIETPNA